MEFVNFCTKLIDEHSKRQENKRVIERVLEAKTDEEFEKAAKDIANQFDLD